MKKQIQILLIPIIALGLCILPVGCGYTGGNVLTTNVTPSESVVVKAEQTLQISKDTFDILLRLEYENRKFVLSNAPAIHTYAEYVRKNAPTWLITANNLKNQYKSGQGNLQALLTALTTLTENTSQSKVYITQLNNQH